MESEDILIYRLSNSNPEAVYEWLDANKPDEDGYFKGGGCRADLEKALLQRKSPLINLGLALFGSEAETAIYLYQNGDDLLKKAVLSGSSFSRSFSDWKWLNTDGVLGELVATKNYKLLKALLSNRFLPTDIWCQLYEGKEYFDALDIDFWLDLILATLRNPSLPSEESKERLYALMGYDEDFNFPWVYGSRYSDIMDSAWRLFNVMPITKRSAAILGKYLAPRLVYSKRHGLDVPEAIKRWKTPSDIQLTDDEIENFEHCRTALGTIIYMMLKESDDSALRVSYYRKFSPKNADELLALLKKDGDLFVDAAVENIALYKNPEIRDTLYYSCCKEYKGPEDEFVGPTKTFRRTQERLKQVFPEWFIEENHDGELILDHIKDPTDRIRERVDSISRKVTLLSNKLLGEDPSDKANEASGALDEVWRTLNNLNASTEDTRKTVNKILWLVVALLSMVFFSKR